MAVIDGATYAGYRLGRHFHVPGFGHNHSDTTNYGGGITSNHGNSLYNGTPFNKLSYEDAERAYRYMLNWRDERGLTTKNSRAEIDKLKQQMDTMYPEYQMRRYQEMMAEYMAGMGEYIGAMTEAMNKVEPAAEPLKQAQAEMSAAKADTDRKQLLRRGLMSTYTRYGQTGGTQRLGA